MSIIIKLLGLPLEATSVDVRLYFLGLKIPDRGVHIVGGDEGTVFIEFASDEDARQAMARGDGVIKNSNVKLLLSSKNEMQTVTEAARQRQQQYLQHQQQLISTQRQAQQQMLPNAQNNNLQNQYHHHQNPNTQQLNHHNQPHQQSSYLGSGISPMGPALLQTSTQQQQSGQPVAASGGDPRMLSQNYQGIMNVMNQQQQQQQTASLATTNSSVPTSQPQILLTQQQTNQQQSAFVDPRILSQNYQGLLPGLGQLNPNFAATTTSTTTSTASHMTQNLLPQNQMFAQQQFLSTAAPTTVTTSNGGSGGLGGAGLNLGLLASMGGLVGQQQSSVGGIPVSLPNNLNLGGNAAAMLSGIGIGNDLSGLNGISNSGVGSNNTAQQQLQQQQNTNNSNNGGANNSGGSSNRNQSPDSRARMSGMRGGDDKLFANKRCVLAASNIPYRTTSKEIIDFLSEFNISEDRIRRRYNQKGQPTADAKIAFPTPDAAAKALKTMNKKHLGGRPVFLKPV